MRSHPAIRHISHFTLVALVLNLAGPALQAEAAPAAAKDPLFCDLVKVKDDASKVGKKWQTDYNSASPQHRAINRGAEREAFLKKAILTLSDVCGAKLSSEAQYGKLRTNAAKDIPTSGESCQAFKSQEQSLVSGAQARSGYIKKALDARDGEKDKPGLRALYKKGAQVGVKIVDEQTNESAKPALETERKWAWGAGSEEGYFTKINQEFEAEVKSAEATQQEIAGYLKKLQAKFPNCKPSEAAKKLAEGGRADGDAARAMAAEKDGGLSGDAETAEQKAKREQAEKDGKAEGLNADATGAARSDGKGQKDPKDPAAGADGKGLFGGEDFLGGNGGLVLGGLALLGAAGAAAALLSGKSKSGSGAGALGAAGGLGGPGGTTPLGAPVDRPATIAIKDSFPFSVGQAISPAAQAVHESHFPTGPAMEARYAKQKAMGIGYRFYNYYWSALEPGAVSSSVPQACAEGFQAVPADEAERARSGFKRFHCYAIPHLQQFDNVMRKDAAEGIQSGVILWSSPPAYRYPDCAGMAWAGGTMKDGCVPRDDAMDDFEDFANFVASRYNGGAMGKVSHFVVWNENASEEWFDYSPVAPKGQNSGAVAEARINKYVEMLKRVHGALLRHQKKALMYVSTDQLWTPGQAPGHMGTRVLLDGIWARLGTDYSWSIAVHPYGNVADAPPANIYTFANLQMVYEYQKAKLAEKGATDTMAYPQAYQAATEQGWAVEAGGNRDNQAKNICLAHDKITRMPFMIATSHNYFHSNEPGETAGGNSSQGAYYGLIPFAVPDTLEGAEATPTGAAYFATGPAAWRKDANNFCCKNYQVGCP